MEYEGLSHVTILLSAQVGSARYGLLSNTSDRDVFILSTDTCVCTHDADKNISYFVLSLDTFRTYWGHPLLLGDITGECSGNADLCAFVRANKRKLTYAAPVLSALFGLDYIAAGERYSHTSPIKAGLRTAMILSHMAEERDDPFLLSDGEKAILIRARTGAVDPDERVEIYRRTLCPENLDKLRRMPENTKVRDELFALLDEICKEETT